MALADIAPPQMKAAALVMNIAVSTISFTAYFRAGHFNYKFFLPFAIGSIPMAFVGGHMLLSDQLYKQLLALCLFIATIRMLVNPKVGQAQRPMPVLIGVLCGAFIGLLSGMLGIGGGVLLSPLILIMHWANVKQTAATSALFILVNSISGLVGFMQKGNISFPPHFEWMLPIVVIAGLMGAYFGSKKFEQQTLKQLLAIGLIIACYKLL
jgi:uncharacterized membrane protein YfcA